eukprot:7098454-Ditylum_brightwellii.AAC.1
MRHHFVNLFEFYVLTYENWLNDDVIKTQPSYVNKLLYIVQNEQRSGNFEFFKLMVVMLSNIMSKCKKQYYGKSVRNMNNNTNSKSKIFLDNGRCVLQFVGIA